jgi:single-stranded-DNA-specific exonuclease
MGKNKNVLKFSLITACGKLVTGIYFGDVEKFFVYIEEKFGKQQLEAALEGRENNIELSVIYFPKINSFRGVDELQFEIQYYQ